MIRYSFVILSALILALFYSGEAFTSTLTSQVEGTNPPIKRLITAEEAAKGGEFFKQNYMLAINKTHSLFLSRGFDQEEISLNYVDADGNITEQSRVNLRETEEKELKKSYILQNGFVVFQYYNPQRQKIGYSKIETRVADEIYEPLLEEWIWDTSTQYLFQIKNSELDHEGGMAQLTRLRALSEFTDPERVLVQEYSIADDIFSSSMRMFNLRTRKFYSGHIIPFTQGLSVVKIKVNVDGSYALPCDNRDASLEGSAIPFLNEKVYCYDSREGYPKGILRPCVRDPESSRYISLLLDEEVSRHKSNISDDLNVDGAIIYKTNFEKPQWHIQQDVTITAKAQTIHLLLDALAESSLNFFMNLHENSEEVLTKFAQLHEQLLSTKTDFSEEQQLKIEGGARFLTRNFITQLFHQFRRDVPLFECLSPLRTTSIKSLDQQFDFPVYYTLPQRRMSDYFIIELHGGPHDREDNSFSVFQQFFTSRGYPYFRFNPRGSSNIGRELGKAIDGNWLSIVDDIKALTNWIQTLGFTRKPIVLGASFGGYASAAAYEMGVSDIAILMSGIFDLEKGLKSISEGHAKLVGQEVYSVEENIKDVMQQYGETSELRHCNSIATYIKAFDDQTLPHRTAPGHVFVYAGKKDTTHLPEYSEDLYNLLKRRGDAVELLTSADADHSFSVLECIPLLRALENFLGDLAGHPFESNGYGYLFKQKGMTYSRANKR